MYEAVLKCNKVLLVLKFVRQRNYETWWRRTTATLLDASFGVTGDVVDVLIERSGYVPLRCLGDLPLRRSWVFYLKLV